MTEPIEEDFCLGEPLPVLAARKHMVVQALKADAGWVIGVYDYKEFVSQDKPKAVFGCQGVCYYEAELATRQRLVLLSDVEVK